MAPGHRGLPVRSDMGDERSYKWRRFDKEHCVTRVRMEEEDEEEEVGDEEDDDPV